MSHIHPREPHDHRNSLIMDNNCDRGGGGTPQGCYRTPLFLQCSYSHLLHVTWEPSYSVISLPSLSPSFLHFQGQRLLFGWYSPVFEGKSTLDTYQISTKPAKVRCYRASFILSLLRKTVCIYSIKHTPTMPRCLVCSSLQYLIAKSSSSLR